MQDGALITESNLALAASKYHFSYLVFPAAPFPPPIPSSNRHPHSTSTAPVLTELQRKASFNIGANFLVWICYLRRTEHGCGPFSNSGNGCTLTLLPNSKVFSK